jgi:PPK2 family polyphosphate:nucleotide phosphotransferase
MADYRKKFLVEPGRKLRLAEIDAGFGPEQATQDDALLKTQKHSARMAELQYLLYADGEQSLLVVLQGPDASGKDGTIRHLFSGMNPQGVSVAKFDAPSHAERAHDFLWRVHARAPARGEVVIFNRSHYEDVLIARVRKLVPKADWRRRFQSIVDFETLLSDNGVRILKFYLHISPEEQLRRFRKRIDDPARSWKISESDYLDRDLWPQYDEAYEEAMAETSTKTAPWFVVPANHKWFRNLVISEIVVETLEEMDLKLPKCSVDLTDIARRYHEAKRAQENGALKR